MPRHPDQTGSATTRLSLRTLGAAGLYVAGRSEPLLGPGKPLALLVFLTLTPGHRTSREVLLNLLWADLDPDRGRSALRQVLFHLRRLLGEDALPGTEELSLSLPIETDRDAFLAALERGDLELALDAYGGSFLPAFGVPGGAAFEQWADLERSRLRAGFLGTCEILVRRFLNQSRFKEAQRLARRARDEAPDSEPAWRLLLEAITASRDFVAAAVEAEALEQWAASEGAILEPATRSAIARARQVTPGPEEGSDRASLVVEMTGREREFATITAAWETARTGSPRHVHLTAPPGLGKTRLLREAVARFRAAGVPVAEVRGASGDRDIPYAFAGDLAVALAELPGATGIAPSSASVLVALNPILSARFAGTIDASAGEESARRRIQALADLVQAVAHERPFVLVIDDLHWVDAASYRILEGLWSRFVRTPVLCLSAGRPERRPADESLLVPLAPLSSEQVGSLVSAVGAIPEGAPWTRTFVSGLHEATRGSPLLVLETLRLTLDEGILSLEDGRWICQDEARLSALLRAGEALRHRVRSLPRDQAWALALLATAGTPLALDELAAAAKRPVSAMADDVRVLERQGLAVQTGSGWIPAHDELAEAVRSGLDPSRQAEADLAIGQLLAGAAEEDAHRLLRGLRHLAAAGSHGLVRHHFRRYARLLRTGNDGRPFRQLASEVLGEHASASRAALLARSLPWRWHLGLWSPTRDAVAVATLALVAATAVLGIQWGVNREAGRQRLVVADSVGTTKAVTVESEDFDGRNTPLGLRPRRSELTEAARTYPELPPAQSPDGRSFAWNQDSGDSTTIDIWIRTPTGARRLTREFRDDLVTDWLPDGTGLVGMTNRWSSPITGGYDIALFDTATGRAQQVTSGPDHDYGAVVSPDGTRIAFLRETEGWPTRVCVVPLEGVGGPDCRLPGGIPIGALVGWSSPTEILAELKGDGGRSLEGYDWFRDQRRLLVAPHVYRSRLSPDRRWIVAARLVDGIRGFHDWIIPVDRPENARQLDAPGAAGTEVRWWEGPPGLGEMVDRIAFSDSGRTLLLGTTTRLRVRAVTTAGTETPIRAPVRWRASDTLVAIVDTAGEVRPRTAGLVQIEASLAGWRSTSASFRVVGDSARTIVTERWDEGWQDRWILFGDPRPVVAVGPNGIRGFWNRGDGTYPSMGVLRPGLSVRNGLGVELQISTPLTRSNWQRLRIALVAGLDTASLRGADQQKAPPTLGRAGSWCGVSYPAASGQNGRNRIDFLGGITQTVNLGSLGDELGAGRWWTLRLQVLPDGRCGMAVNGRVLWISPEPIPLDAEYRLRLGDESAGSRLLHGPLTVWSGVRTDIDWP